MDKKHNKPRTSGDNGERDGNGRFVKGHKGMTGPQPTAIKSKQLREALLAAVTAADIQEIVKKLVAKAKAGDVQATKEIFDRCLGKPQQSHNVEGGDLAFRLILGEPKPDH
jgi:hypothetical protein